MKTNHRIVQIIVLFLLPIFGGAQTCCSSGIPIASNVGFASQGSGVLTTSVHYENNQLSTLLDESDVLALNNRQRNTQSYLWRIGYQFTERWSTEVLVPYVTQNRNITKNNGEIDQEQARGLGDIALLLKYDLVKRMDWNLNVGIGTKLTSGDSKHLNRIGLLLVKDLQPGTGALDWLGRLAIEHHPSFHPSMNIFLSAIYSLKGTDAAYLGSQAYRFGNDWQLFFGAGDQWTFGNTNVSPSIGFRYRRADQDLIDGIDLRNTGGQWVFLRPHLGINVLKNVQLLSTLELPIYSRVDGTQLSPTYIFNLGILANLSLVQTNKITLP
jgi:hypothetical protein